MKYLNILLLPLLLWACSGEVSKENDKPLTKTKGKEKKVEATALSAGKINAGIKCGSGANETYDIYLPNNFSKEKNWPLIIAFDPQGDGGLPLENYKNLADKYGFVLVGSNYSKNGMQMPAVQQHYRQLVDNISGKLDINKQRFYLAGFSGGAKVATYLGLGDNDVDGVIACGAATKFKVPEKPFIYSAIAGKGDFNSQGMFYSYLVMEKMKLPYTFQYFDGKHEWPPTKTMENTFRWLELEAMKKGEIETDKTKISTWMRESENQLSSISGQGNPLEFEAAYKSLITMYDGLADVSSYKEAIRRRESSGQSATATKQFETSFGAEEAQKSTYVQALNSKDLNWWKNEIEKLKKAAKAKGEGQYQPQRVLGYLGLLVYMQATPMINTNKNQEAEKFVSIYLLLEPENPEAHYLNGILSARKGNAIQAISSLQKAVELGFDDKERLDKQTEFGNLKGKDGFPEL